MVMWLCEASAEEQPVALSTQPVGVVDGSIGSHCSDPFSGSVVKHQIDAELSEFLQKLWPPVVPVASVNRSPCA